MDFTLKIWRQKNAKSKGHFETYKVKNISPDTSFLEMLIFSTSSLLMRGIDPVAVSKGCKENSNPWHLTTTAARVSAVYALYINGRAHGPTMRSPLVNSICANSRMARPSP